MSGQGTSRLVTLGVAFAIGVVAAYLNNRYSHVTPTQVDIKADRGMSEIVEVPLPSDLWNLR